MVEKDGSQYSSEHIFNMGFTCALFLQIGILGLNALPIMLLTQLCSIFILVPSYESLECIFPQLAIDAGIMLFYILRENIHKESFIRGAASKNDLEQFKSLLAKDLPVNLLIIQRDLSKVLFSNNSLENLVRQHEITVENCLQFFQLAPDKANQMGFYNNSPVNHEEIAIPTTNNFEAHLKALLAVDGLVDEGLTTATYFFDEEKKRRSFDTKIVPLKWNETDALAIILNEITQQEVNAALRQADANKDKVIATISHELRTPVNAMLGVIQLLKKKAQDQEISKYIAICESSSNLLLNLINSILDLQQIRTNLIKVNPVEFDLREIFDEITTLFEFQCVQKGLNFRTELAKNLPEEIYTDKNRLSQILINLTSNALKFTFTGEIVVGAKIDPLLPNKIQFYVSDTGIGITKEVKKNLFKMFGRLDSKREVSLGGCGLGLTICNGLVKLLNDDENEIINVTGEYGQGATFSFRIPGRPYNSGADSFSILDEINEEEEDIDEKLTDHTFKSRANLDHSHKQLLAVRKLTSKSSRNLLLTTPDTPSGRKKSSSFRHRKIIQKITSSPFAEKYVLLVDDNDFNILVTRQLVESYNLKVKTAYNGQQAIDVVKAHVKEHDAGFDLILMDCQMPVMDGYQATIKLREMMKENEVPWMPIIALSANDLASDKQRCFDVGMDDHISKPLKEATLADLLEVYGLILPKV